MIQNRPKTFVLVHGAWHGAWCYARVEDILIRNGHRVHTPTLSGVGERSHLRGGKVNLSTHVQDVANLIRYRDLSDIVLVGHSYAGMVVTVVADQLAERIASLVYLDAFLPQDAQCLHDLAPPAHVEAQVQSATEANGYTVTPITAAAFNVNEADRAWVDRLCTPQPLATFTERIKLTGRIDSVPRKTYVLATRNHPGIGFERFRDAVAGNARWQTRELACGHDVMIDLPQETAAILMAAAT